MIRSIVGQCKGPSENDFAVSTANHPTECDGYNEFVKLRSVMDDGRILIANLSKGRIGDDASNLLGSFVVTALQQAAMSRAGHGRAGAP